MGGDSTFSKGDHVDRFEIRELIAEGGMGAIYRAVDTRLQKTVALKVVRRDRLGSSTGEQARQRFLREALAMSKVDHRNVVRVLDFGFSSDTPYLVMEYLRGRDLGKLVKATSAPLPVAEVVDVMLGVCAAIRACHDAGIIHRDLKPSNVFLCESDSEREVKILDFGVSKAAIEGDLTREGQILGTPQYLAPEQVDGTAVPQTDQYAIGVMLYLCLTKSLPYQNHASFGLLRAIVAGKFAPPRTLRADLPEKLEAIILRAMRTAPEDRFESVRALGRELWAFASPEARERWRSYYLDDPLRAPPKASTHAMPLIEAMVRGIAAGTPPREALALAPTEPSPPAVGRPPVAERTVAEKPDSVDPQTPATAGEGKSSGAPPKRRTTTPFVAVGALALVAASAWLILRPPSGGDSPTLAPPVAPIAPTAPIAPAAPPAPLPQAVPVTPAAPRAPSVAVPSARQAEQSTIARPSPSRERAPRPPSPTRPERRHRRDNRPAPSEQTSDGIPIMP